MLAELIKLVPKLVHNRTKKQRQVIIDLDSTHTNTFGQQEDIDFKTHYQTNGYHLLLAYDSFSGYLLEAKLRLCKEHTSKNAKEFLKSLLKQYTALDLLVWVNSGLAKPEIYDACKETGTIYLKASPKL